MSVNALFYYSSFYFMSCLGKVFQLFESNYFLVFSRTRYRDMLRHYFFATTGRSMVLLQQARDFGAQ